MSKTLRLPNEVLRPTTINSIEQLMNHWIGLDTFFANTPVNSRQTFPPYDIIKEGTDYSIVLALAGYSIDDISITVIRDQLIVESIEADKSNTPDKDTNKQYVHRGIAKRSFKQIFNLSPNILVESAMMKDGILTISLYTEIPKTDIPKPIPILSYKE